MSYNIDSVKYISGELFISHKNVVELRKQYGDDAPEANFLDEIDASEVSGPDSQHRIDHPLWYGEGSGSRFDIFKKVLSKTTGEAEILLVWEGGDSITGLHVKDGVVTEKDVRFVLE